MPQNRHILNKRYARALLSLVLESNVLERSHEDMKKVHAVFRDNKELQIILRSPAIRLSKKTNVLDHLFRNAVHPLILRYMLLVVRKQRGHMLEGISREYLRVYKQYLGIERIEVITAVPMDDSLRAKALEAGGRITPCAIEFEESVDPGIIGGFILRMDEKEYNASVAYRLYRLRKHLNIN